MRRSPLGPGSKALERGSSFKAAPKPLARVSPLKAGENERPRRSSLKPGRGFSASPTQRAKVKGAVSIVSGEYGCDAAHIWPRGMGGCQHELCVVPLTRQEHDAYDNNTDPARRDRLDLLPYLIAHNMIPELCHALEHARGDLIGLLHVLTGVRWVPDNTDRKAA